MKCLAPYEFQVYGLNVLDRKEITKIIITDPNKNFENFIGITIFKEHRTHGKVKCDVDSRNGFNVTIERTQSLIRLTDVIVFYELSTQMKRH